MKDKNQFANVIRWTARIIGILMVLFTVIMGVGEMLESYNKHGVSPLDTFDSLTIVIFIFWIAGLAGLIVALWKEGMGGLISLVSFIVFIALVALNPNPESHFSYVLFAFVIPSVLYLHYWWLMKEASNNTSQQSEE